jgi:hypothetical protein
MKNLLKIEELAILLLFSVIYFHFYHGTWLLYLGLFFIPDIAFVLYLISNKIGAIFYNIFHNKGGIIALILTGYFLQNERIVKIGLIFMAHSSFDRVAGYGLKYFDSFDHTHLGWIGKSKHKNGSIDFQKN